MSIFRLTKDHFQKFELIANPKRQFTSSSDGITGSVSLFADDSTSIKELASTFGNASGSIDDNTVDLWRETLSSKVASGSSTNFYGDFEKYLSLVNDQPSSPFLSKKQEILRFTPGVKFDKNLLRKSSVRKVLFPYYRNTYPSLQWSYTNYNSLNFVTGGNLPTKSVLIYPAGTGSVAKENWNPLGPANRFTFDFWINPRYTTVKPGAEFTAGTIMHMSSCYAISLVTGSSIGIDGKPDGYRMMLQLSHSADVNPSSVNLSTENNTRPAPQEWIFLSDDNSLKRNTWHHVAIRWDSSFDFGTGSFHIDGKNQGIFNVTSSSVMQVTSSGADLLDPDALFIGNYYEGSNKGASAIAKFFNKNAHEEEGVLLFNDLLITDPVNYSLPNPLNAELHEIKIYDRYRSTGLIYSSSKTGASLDDPGLLFYVPPFFTKDSRNRLILQTPFFDTTGSTEDPFNVALSFGVGGMCVNLENFTKDLVTKQFPRLLNLTASRIDTQINTPRTANYLLYESGSTRKRNLTVLPCDNGKFFPNFDLLKTSPSMGITNSLSGSYATSSFSGSFNDKFTDDFGNPNYTFVSLENMVSTSSLIDKGIPNAEASSGSLLVPLQGATPEDPGVSPGNILTILQRQHDPSSNEIVFFDMSNMFYGDEIKPGTFLLEDLSVSGSGGRMTFKVRDNKHGNLYRADCSGSHATWASVGNILYEEGMAIIKTPHMPHFGNESFKVTFEGQKSVYVLEVMVPATEGLHNSSSNPAYTPLIPTNYASEIADEFTYITGISLHDNNMNVIARANLAQPVVKRDTDRIVFKLRMDF